MTRRGLSGRPRARSWRTRLGRGLFGMLAASLATVALSTLPAPTIASDAGEPMSNADVVLRVLADVPEGEILAEIASRATAFDVSEEMLDELRIAGVPDDIRDAMVAASDADAASPRGAAAELTKIELHVELATADGETPEQTGLSLRIPTLVALPGADDETDAEPVEVTGAALFVVCTRSSHVPGHWTSATRLDTETGSIPRHRLLAFRSADLPDRKGDDVTAGKRPRRRGPRARWRRVSIPTAGSTTIELPDEGDHDLVVGIAIEAGSRWLTATRSERYPAPEGASLPEAVRVTLEVDRDDLVGARWRWEKPPGE